MFGAAAWGQVPWADFPQAVVAPVPPPPTPAPTPVPAPEPTPPPPAPKPVGVVVPPVTTGGNAWGWDGLDQFYQALDSFYDDLRREQERLKKKKKRKKKNGEIELPGANVEPALIRYKPPRFDAEAEDLWLLGVDLALAEEEGRI